MKTAVIIDVRESKEFRDGSIEGAVNLPFTEFHTDQYHEFRENLICLVCHSGSRAKQVRERLLSKGFEHVILLDRHMETINQKENSKGWSVDRQFRLILGFLFISSFLGYFLGLPETLYFGTAIASALIITAIIDRCYLRMGIALLPWNKSKNN